MNTKLCAALAGALSLAAGAAAAAPFTYTFHQEQAVGTLNGAPFAGTYDWTVTADTTTAAATTILGSPAVCVTGTSSTISINGAAPITVTTPLFVCLADNDLYAGFYKDPAIPQFPTLVGDPLPGADLTVPGVFAIPAGSLHNHGFSGGDVATSAGPLITTGPENNNLAGSTFTIASAAPPPATVPTLTEWAMILLAAGLAAMAGLTLHRRRQAA